MVGVGGVGHAEAGVGGGEALAVELGVAGHAEALQIHAGGNDLGVAPGLLQPAGGTGEVAAAGVGAHHHVGVSAAAVAELVGQLPAQGLHAAHAKGGVQGGIEKAGLLQHHQHLIEQLRTHRQLEHFRAQGLALAGLLHDLRLAAALGVVALLDNDALQALHRGLGSHCRAIVAAGGGDDALVAHLFGLVDGGHRPAFLKASGGVGRLVLDENTRALAGSGALAGQFGQVLQLEDGGVAHVELLLQADVILQGVAGVVHHVLVAESDGTGLVAAVVHAHGLVDDLTLAACDGLIALIYDHTCSPPNNAPRSCSSISRISGTKQP